MTFRLPKFVILALALSTLATQGTSAAAKPRVAVFLSDKFGNVGTGGSQLAYGNIAAGEISAQLSQSPRVEVVESSRLQQYEAEIGKSLKEGMSEDTRKSIGELLSADYFVIPRVEYVRDATTQEEIDVTDNGNIRERKITLKVAKVTVYVDLTRVETGVKKTIIGRAEVTASERAEREEALRDRAIKAAAVTAVRNLVDEIRGDFMVNAAVVSVVPDPDDKKGKKKIVVVNAGANLGVESYMQFEVSRPAGSVKDPATGKELLLPSKAICKIRIDEVGDETSTFKTKEDVQVGDRLKYVPSRGM